ncbi:hypothetical protein [Methylomonas sp. MgM2]
MTLTTTETYSISTRWHQSTPLVISSSFEEKRAVFAAPIPGEHRCAESAQHKHTGKLGAVAISLQAVDLISFLRVLWRAISFYISMS